MYDDLVGLLSHITQKGSVLDYQAAFEELESQVRGFSLHNLMSIFIAAFLPCLRHAIQSTLALDFHNVFSLACLHEVQFTDID